MIIIITVHIVLSNSIFIVPELNSIIIIKKLTLIPWKSGIDATSKWDVTVTDTMAQSHLPMSSQTPGAAANRKIAKYASLTQTYHPFVSIAAEAMGAINSDATALNFSASWECASLELLMTSARAPSCSNARQC